MRQAIMFSCYFIFLARTQIFVGEIHHYKIVVTTQKFNSDDIEDFHVKISTRVSYQSKDFPYSGFLRYLEIDFPLYDYYHQQH